MKKVIEELFSLICSLLFITALMYGAVYFTILMYELFGSF